MLTCLKKFFNKNSRRDYGPKQVPQVSIFNVPRTYPERDVGAEHTSGDGSESSCHDGVQLRPRHVIQERTDH